MDSNSEAAVAFCMFMVDGKKWSFWRILRWMVSPFLSLSRPMTIRWMATVPSDWLKKGQYWRQQPGDNPKIFDFSSIPSVVASHKSNTVYSNWSRFQYKKYAFFKYSWANIWNMCRQGHISGILGTINRLASTRFYVRLQGIKCRQSTSKIGKKSDDEYLKSLTVKYWLDLFTRSNHKMRCFVLASKKANQ